MVATLLGWAGFPGVDGALALGCWQSPYRSVMVAACVFLLFCYCYHYYCIELWNIDAGIVFGFAYIFLEILYILYYYLDTVILD